MKKPLYVFVRFEVNKGEQDTLTALIRDFFEQEVSSFPGFLSYKLHVNEEGTVLINYATWESAEHFQKFTAFASTSERSKKIQAYHPHADRLHEVVL